MSIPVKYLTLSLAALAAACGGDAGSPVEPPAPDVVPAAPGLSAVMAPALLLNSHALYYCYHPGMTRNCVVLKRTLRLTSSGAALKWTTSKSQPWITVSPAAGTTPTTVTISVDTRQLPPPPVFAAFGTVTVFAVGAFDSPQKVSVVVNYRAMAPALPSLAFSDSAIGFCDSPGSTRNCVRLAEHVLFTSTGAALAWKATASQPWIVIQPASGTTDTDVRVSVDLTRLPSGHGTSVSGSLTVSSGGARNSPQTIPVKLQFYSTPPPQ
jgi:BACON domain-containing protein